MEVEDCIDSGKSLIFVVQDPVQHWPPLRYYLCKEKWQNLQLVKFAVI